MPELPEIKNENRDATPGNQLPEKTGVGRDMERFGEEVVNRIDRIVKKKGFDLWGDPWTLQGIPIIFPSSSNGFNLGLHVAVQNIRREDPHLVEVAGQVLASDKGRYKHFFRLDFPHAFDDAMRITARVGYDRDISLPFFGIGNSTKFDQQLFDRDSPLYQNTRSGPSFQLNILAYLGRHFRAGPVVGLKWVDVGVPAGSLLQSQRPSGIDGGRTHYLGLAVIHDTLDFEPYPSRGSTNELFLMVYNEFTGSNYDFFRGTYTYRRFMPLHRKLILAHRTLFEVLTGDVPFYELGAVGGSRGGLSIGGDSYLRGYTENRYLDKIRLALGFELRWDPLFLSIYRQDLTLGFVPFFDIGRVWPSFREFKLDNFHASTGWGMRLIWNSRFIIRADWAVNHEGTAFYINLGNAF